MPVHLHSRRLAEGSIALIESDVIVLPLERIEQSSSQEESIPCTRSNL